MEKLVEFLGLHTEEGGLLIDFACAEQLHGDSYHSSAGALSVTGLEHPELAVLDGELHVLHILEVSLKFVGDSDQLGGAYWH